MKVTKSNNCLKELPPFSDYLTSQRDLIEGKLKAFFQTPHVAHESLYQAAQYALLGGGKRVRPILAMAVAEALGAINEKSLIPACALELVHAYSLIHDDLPCMDDDDFRRGKPTVHKAFTEAHAVLAGDFLLTKAFELLASAPHLSAEQKVDLVRLLASGAGGDGMIAGQILDIESEGKHISIEQLQQIHQYKTGALITTSVLFGAIIGNANLEQTKILKLFAEDIGLAFQIVDDILDVTENLKRKDTHYSSDIKNNKSTYVSLIGMDRGKEIVNELFLSAQTKLDTLFLETTRLKELTSLIVHRHS